MCVNLCVSVVSVCNAGLRVSFVFTVEGQCSRSGPGTGFLAPRRSSLPQTGSVMTFMISISYLISSTVLPKGSAGESEEVVTYVAQFATLVAEVFIIEDAGHNTKIALAR